MTNRTLAQIERRIEKIKSLLNGIGEMRPGSLTQQFKDREAQTGPYYQLSYTWRGKSSSRFLRAEQVETMREKVANYKRLRELVQEWVELAVALERAEREQAK